MKFNRLLKKLSSVLLALTLALSVLGAAAPCAFAEETPLLAFDATVNGYFTDDAHTADYLLTLPSTGTVTLTYRSGAFYTDICLIAKDQTIYSVSTTEREPDICGADISLRLVAGTYLLTLNAVYHLNVMASDYGDFSLKASFTAETETFPESLDANNDTTETANSISLGAEITGLLCHNDEKDCYRLEITEPGVLTWELRSSPETSGFREYLWLELFDKETPLLNTPAYSVSKDGYTGRITVSLIPGVYDMILSTAYNELHDYTFTTAFTPVQETFAERQGALLNENTAAPAVKLGGTYQGFIAHNDNEDIYRFTVSEPCSLTVRPLTGSSETCFTMKLEGYGSVFYTYYDTERFILNTGETEGSLEPGVYFLHVDGGVDGEMKGAYSFMLYQRGDVDHSGAVTAGDARLALRASVRLETIEEGSAAFFAADYDKDGVISAADARSILRRAVGLSD